MMKKNKQKGIIAMSGIWINQHTFVNFKEKKEWNLSDEIASRKRTISFSAIGSMLPNPDPVLKKLGKDMSVYRELMVEGHVGSCIVSRKSGVKSLLWEINRGKAKSRQVKAIEDKFKKLNLIQVIDEMLEAPLMGYQPLEIIWKEENSLILPQSITGKPPEWFCFDSDNKLRFRSRESYLEGELLPSKKFLLLQYNASYNNPYGIPELSKVFWPVAFKKGGLKFWAVFTEKYGMPIILGKYPRGTKQADKDALAKALQNAIQDAVITIEIDSEVNLLDSPFKASSAGVYKGLIDSCNGEISKAILGQTLTTEVGDSGSRALGDVHFKVRGNIVNSDKLMVCQAMNTLLTWIWEINFPASSEIPTFEMWIEENVDFQLAERDEKLKNIGVKFTKKYFIKTYGFDEDDIEIDTTEPPTPAEFAEEKKESFPLDDIMAKIPPEELQEIAEEVLEPIINLVKNSGSYEEIMEKLTEQYPLMKNEKMEDILRKAIFYANLQGQEDANAGN